MLDVRCLGYNTHSHGDLFEALLKCTFVKHSRSLTHPREVVAAVVEFVDKGKNGVKMIRPDWTGVLPRPAAPAAAAAAASELDNCDDDKTENKLLASLLTDSGLLLFATSKRVLVAKANHYEAEAKKMGVVQPEALPHVQLQPQQPVQSVEPVQPVERSVHVAEGLTPESRHTYPSTLTRWCTRSGDTSEIRWFPCCGALAIEDATSRLVYSVKPCIPLAGVKHTGRPINQRTSRAKARASAPPAMWSCCFHIAVKAEGAPAKYALCPADSCGDFGLEALVNL